MEHRLIEISEDRMIHLDNIEWIEKRLAATYTIHFAVAALDITPEDYKKIKEYA